MGIRAHARVKTTLAYSSFATAEKLLLQTGKGLTHALKEPILWLCFEDIRGFEDIDRFYFDDEGKVFIADR